MKELGFDKIASLISTLDDAYTPNKQVNRLTIIQEQKMLKLALERVSIEKLSSSLGISIETLRGRSQILNGIDSEVVSLLSDKHIPRATFDILKKMKPLRQIEVANIMVSFANFSKSFALHLLIQNETKRIEEIYGANTLKLVIAKSYINKLLDNAKILHWLLEKNPEYLNELKKYLRLIL
ncbi:plasmid partitioning protein RepB C-terminal domain-containing protein [Xenorhabdus sp. IM139775]|nr:plasmid partitioning protein RepB C-terminal domain-containing protein [Xenorhabdus sp. IM139775]MDC9594109.1 plasmid partitioning protein RepB C-terminal domain-containing protein [Xenorhabdus sp. IM139775]